MRRRDFLKAPAAAAVVGMVGAAARKDEHDPDNTKIATNSGFWMV